MASIALLTCNFIMVSVKLPKNLVDSTKNICKEVAYEFKRQKEPHLVVFYKRWQDAIHISGCSSDFAQILTNRSGIPQKLHLVDKRVVRKSLLW